MPEPVFGEQDRVQPAVKVTSDLPAELQGVTDPVKIAKYYQDRETRLRDAALRAVEAAKGTPTPTPTPDKGHPMTPAEIQGARNTLILTAKREASQNKKYWERLQSEIEKIMGACSPEQQVDSATWETAYNSLVGANLARLQAEDREAEATATRIASERANPAADQPVTPGPLDPRVASKILPGLEISEKQYRTADEMLKKADQPWPLTFGKGQRNIHEDFKPAGGTR
jgi:hypothetical protein